MLFMVSGYEDRVVLDIGSLYVKVGLSGESKPRHMIPITIPSLIPGIPEPLKTGVKVYKAVDYTGGLGSTCA
jgi:actin-related protein